MTRKRIATRSVSAAAKERWLIESYHGIGASGRNVIDGMFLALNVPTPAAIRAEIERHQRARDARWAKEHPSSGRQYSLVEWAQ